jgi:hypothetical protein
MNFFVPLTEKELLSRAETWEWLQDNARYFAVVHISLDAILKHHGELDANVSRLGRFSVGPLSKHREFLKGAFRMGITSLNLVCFDEPKRWLLKPSMSYPTEQHPSHRIPRMGSFRNFETLLEFSCDNSSRTTIDWLRMKSFMGSHDCEEGSVLDKLYSNAYNSGFAWNSGAGGNRDNLIILCLSHWRIGKSQMFKQRLHMTKDSKSFSLRKEWNYSTVRQDRRHFDISNHREISSSHKANEPKPMSNNSPLEIRTFIVCRHNIQLEPPCPVADFIIHVMDVKKR